MHTSSLLSREGKRDRVSSLVWVVHIDVLQELAAVGGVRVCADEDLLNVPVFRAQEKDRLILVRAGGRVHGYLG